MKYKFIPDSYNYKLVNEKFLDDNQFLQCQILYKAGFEQFLCKYIDFSIIDEYIATQDIYIPILKDQDYNFYHKFSKIGSNYIYIRNNYHVENLTDEEIRNILEHKNLEDSFFNNTFKKVLFESGVYTFMGIPMDETSVNSQSIIFEFAFNQIECKNIEQLNKIKEIIEKSFKTIDSYLDKRVGINGSYIIYDGILDLFFNNINESKIKL